jgi:DNA-binding response OmpR family regulator
MSVAKIFILEDDPSLNDTLVEYFEDKGFSVNSEFDGFEAESTLYENRYDLLIFDVNVPSLDGFNLLKSIREFGVNTPVIFLTAKDGIEDIKTGFGVGAEDYIKKPFVLEELSIRVEAILSRYNKGAKEVKLAENITFNSSVGEIVVDNNSYKLSNKESRLLEIFVASKGEILSHEAIFSELWEYDETPSDSSLRTYIKNLRKILGKDSIESIKKRGYRYISKG